MTSDQIPPYLNELHFVCDRALAVLDHLDALGRSWVRSRAPYQASPEDPKVELMVSRATEFFWALDQFLVVWARASLLLFPVETRSALSSFTKERGRVIRALLGLPETHLLSDRRLRDAWQHVDERLDRLIAEGTYEGRHICTSTRKAAVAVGKTVRVIDAEGMEVHLPDRDGATVSFRLQDLRNAIQDVVGRLDSAWKELRGWNAGARPAP